jgi:hypothetical protein
MQELAKQRQRGLWFWAHALLGLVSRRAALMEKLIARLIEPALFYVGLAFLLLLSSVIVLGIAQGC